MGDIILQREDDTQVMKLDDDEQALLDEISVSQEKTVNVSPANMIRKPNFKTKQPKKYAPVRRQQVVNTDPEIDAFTNPHKRSAPPQPPPDMYEDEEEEEVPPEFGNEYDMDEEDVPMGADGGQGMMEMPSKGYASVDEEKADLLNKLTRLEKKGLKVNKKLNAYSSISDIRTEYKRITYSIEVDSSIKFSRKMLVACVSGLEFLNKRYNPVDVYLDGWSESVVENLDDYDVVFEDLYNKYKTKMEVAPEVKLIMMIGGSAMMYHLTNSMFKAAIPNMNDVLKQNPDLVKNMVDAVKNTNQGGAPSMPSVSQQQQEPSFDSSGRREMKGPGIDLTSLMGGMMPPPPPVNTSQKTNTLSPVEEESDDDISDIISISGESTGGEVRDVTVTAPKRSRRRTKKKTEISI